MQTSIPKIDYINRDCHHKQSNHKTCQGCLDKKGRVQSKGLPCATILISCNVMENKGMEVWEILQGPFDHLEIQTCAEN